MTGAIKKIADRYNYLKSRNVNCYFVSHEKLAQFFQQKQALDPALREASTDDKHALSLKNLLNYLAFEYANCPLLLSYGYYYRDKRFERIREHAKWCSMAYPSLAAKINPLLDTIVELQNCDDNPLLEGIERNIGFSNATLNLVNPDHTQAVLDMCDDYGIKINIGSPGAPSDVHSQKGIFCGCAKFFPSHSFWSPEYQEIYLIRYSWFSDYIRPVLQANGQSHSVKTPEMIVRREESAALPAPEVAIDNPDQDFDVEMLNRYRSTSSGRDAFDDIEAKVVVLRGGKFVLLPAAEDYRHHCITNLDSLDGRIPTVKKISISEFDKYSAVLLRERGKGDYVVEVANNLLGARADLARNHQQQWKELLRNLIDDLGVTGVSKELRDVSCRTAAPQNLRNWASPRFIRPDDENDFICLLKHLGLEDDIAAIVKSMNRLRAAHRRAGHEVNKQLRRLAQSDDNLQSIFADGYRIYKTEQGEKLGVYMFEKFLEKTISVHYTETGNVRNVEELYG